MTTRENGHYWVKVVNPPWQIGEFVGPWTVAEWIGTAWCMPGDGEAITDGPHMRVVEDRLVLPCAAARMDLVDELEAEKAAPVETLGGMTTNQLNPPMDPVQPDGQ